ncbi:MAG: hypothetical protein WKF96_10810 [Solirubrobacteraceae bacterium]
MAARPVLAALLVAGAAAGLGSLPAHAGLPGVVDLSVPAARDTDPVVLTGKEILASGSDWATPENLNAAITQKDVACFAENQDVVCPEAYNHYQEPDADTATATSDSVEGTTIERILGYRWKTTPGKNGGHFQQIPFQVDEVFSRYLNNNSSGFGVYSGTDKHTTYAFDREGFRFTENSGPDGCIAAMKDGDETATDPVKGLDTNDELAFMAADAGDMAPTGAELPKGIDGVKRVTLLDPSDPGAAPRYAYVMRAAEDGPKPAFDATNGYIDYTRDANYDTLVASESSYDDYGPGKIGPYCTPDGQPALNEDGTRAVAKRKPLDTVTISTSRYQFRYDGRWLMTRVQIADDGDKPFGLGKVYGPDLVDRWKARAFAQDSGSRTPCCGYEEEDTNWGGSSSLLGERVGPVRVIRETWGADSGTNVIRRETFYRERMVQKSWLRVHVVPPVDGIYAQWDFNAGRMTRFFNSYQPDGVDVDGVNDEMYGNFDDPCNPRWDANDRTDTDTLYRDTYRQAGLCEGPVAEQQQSSIDPGDATFADANASLGWSQISGPHGTIVDRIHAQPTDLTPGGLAQSLAAVPYYRDDACFDDGTGADPGPELFPRQFDKEQESGANGKRRCWTKADGPTNPDGGDRGDERFWQGSIGTHGLHILFLADSDNARQPVPLTEIVSDWDLIMLPPSETLDEAGNPINVGESYGRQLEKPLVAVVTENPPAP